MNRRIYWLLIPSFIVLFTLGGCGKPPAPAESQSLIKPYPIWYNNPQPNDEQYMYATGSGENQDEAVRNALSSMISELGISIESTFESNMEVKASYATKEIKSKIKTNISKVRISNYEVLLFEKMRYNETVVLIRSDKKDFSNSLQKSLSSKSGEIEESRKIAKNENSLERYNTYVELAVKAKGLLPEIMVLSSVDKTFDESKYVKLISLVDKELSDAKKNLKFYVSGDKNSELFETEIKNFLTDKGLNLTSKQSPGNIDIKINTQVRVNNLSDSTRLSVFSIDIKAFTNNKRIGGKSLILKERYSGSLDNSYKSAAIHLSQDMTEQDIEEVIGLRIN